MNGFQDIIDASRDESTHTAKAIAEAVNGALGEGSSLSDATIRTRWNKPIGEAIGVRNIKRGKSYSAVYREACISYARRGETYPASTIQASGRKWVAAVKAALKDVVIEPEVVDTPFSGGDDMVAPGTGRDALIQSALVVVEPESGDVLSVHTRRMAGRANRDFEVGLDIYAAEAEAHEHWQQQNLRAAFARGERQGSQEFQLEQAAKARRMNALRREATDVLVGNDSGEGG